MFSSTLYMELFAFFPISNVLQLSTLVKLWAMYSLSPGALYKYISYLVDDLEIPALKDVNDTVDIEAFWRQIELSIMARGLIRGMGTKLFPLLSMQWLMYSRQVE